VRAEGISRAADNESRIMPSSKIIQTAKGNHDQSGYSQRSASIEFSHDAFNKWEEFAAICASRHAGNSWNTILSGW